MKNAIGTNGHLKAFTKRDGNQFLIGTKVTWHRDGAKEDGLEFAFKVDGDASHEIKTVVKNQMQTEALNYIKSIKSNPEKFQALTTKLEDKLNDKDDRERTKAMNAESNKPSYMEYDNPYIVQKVLEVTESKPTISFDDVLKMQAEK